MLKEYISEKSNVLVSGYYKGRVIAALGELDEISKNGIYVKFPKMNGFSVGDKVTVHLDNRTGMEEINHDFSIYRTSLKGVVKSDSNFQICIEYTHFDMFYSSKIVRSYTYPGYKFPKDNRQKKELQETPLQTLKELSKHESGNKLGVFITKAIERPHTTVMAFLSTVDDDIFLISHNGTFKSQNIYRDSECAFAIDHRAAMNYEKAIDWNYTIIRGNIHKVSKNNKLFDIIQKEFIKKNPWEYVFFSDENVEMYHIKPKDIIHSHNILD